MHNNCAGFNNVFIPETFSYSHDKCGDLDEADIKDLGKQ